MICRNVDDIKSYEKKDEQCWRSSSILHSVDILYCERKENVAITEKPNLLFNCLKVILFKMDRLRHDWRLNILHMLQVRLVKDEPPCNK